MSENPKEIDVYALARDMGAETPKRRKSSGLVDPDGLQEKFEQLTGKYEELYFLSRAMWELVREKTDLREVDLEGKLAEIEARQRVATKPKAQGCPECDRPLQRIEGKHHKCIYCGYIQAFDSPFDKLL